MKQLLLGVLLGATVVFCVMNRDLTPVWPFKAQVPLFLVILAAFVLGWGAGWLVRALASSRRQAGASSPKAAEAVVER